MKKTSLVWMFAAMAGATVLQGCVPLIVTGAALTAVSVADRRTTGTQIEDKTIQRRVESSISDHIAPVKGSISAVSYNRRVLLIGQASGTDVKEEAGRLAQAVPNVRDVVNEIEITNGIGFGDKANDTYVTSKVKTSLVDAKDVPASTINVTTERGTVYLMGLATEAEGDKAAQVASQVSGVKRVVKVFEVISNDEAERINASRKTDAPVTPARGS